MLLRFSSGLPNVFLNSGRGGLRGICTLASMSEEGVLTCAPHRCCLTPGRSLGVLCRPRERAKSDPLQMPWIIVAIISSCHSTHLECTQVRQSLALRVLLRFSHCSRKDRGSPTRGDPHRSAASREGHGAGRVAVWESLRISYIYRQGCKVEGGGPSWGLCTTNPSFAWSPKGIS